MELNILNPKELEFKLENQMKKEVALKYEEAFDLKDSILKELKITKQLHKYKQELIKELEQKLFIIEEIEKRIDLFLIETKEKEDKIIPKHNSIISDKIKEWQKIKTIDFKFSLEEIRCVYAYRVKLFSENYIQFLSQQKIRETKEKLFELKEDFKEINKNISRNLIKQGWIAVFWTFLLSHSIFSSLQVSANFSNNQNLSKSSRMWTRMIIQKNINEIVFLKNSIQDILLNSKLSDSEKEEKIKNELDSVENKQIKEFLENNSFSNLKDFVKLTNNLNKLSLSYMI